MPIAVAQLQRKDKRSLLGTAVRDALSEALSMLGESQKAQSRICLSVTIMSTSSHLALT